jgi:hypothetical protein
MEGHESPRTPEIKLGVARWPRLSVLQSTLNLLHLTWKLRLSDIRPSNDACISVTASHVVRWDLVTLSATGFGWIPFSSLMSIAF